MPPTSPVLEDPASNQIGQPRGSRLKHLGREAAMLPMLKKGRHGWKEGRMDQRKDGPREGRKETATLFQDGLLEESYQLESTT